MTNQAIILNFENIVNNFLDNWILNRPLYTRLYFFDHEGQLHLGYSRPSAKLDKKNCLFPLP